MIKYGSNLKNNLVWARLNLIFYLHKPKKVLHLKLTTTEKFVPLHTLVYSKPHIPSLTNAKTSLLCCGL